MATQSGPAAGLRASLERRLDRLAARPLFRKLDPFIGLSELRRFNPLIAEGSLGSPVALPGDGRGGGCPRRGRGW